MWGYKARYARDRGPTVVERCLKTEKKLKKMRPGQSHGQPKKKEQNGVVWPGGGLTRVAIGHEVRYIQKNDTVNLHQIRAQKGIEKNEMQKEGRCDKATGDCETSERSDGNTQRRCSWQHDVRRSWEWWACQAIIFYFSHLPTMGYSPSKHLHIKAQLVLYF